MDEEAIKKSQVLIEALPYILAFKDKFTVVKYGGSIMREPRLSRAVLLDIVFMATVGMKVVVVHGGGHRISEALQDKGLDSFFNNGLRYTDKQTLRVVKETILRVNQELANTIKELGGKVAAFLPEEKVLTAARLAPVKGKDLGLVGEISRVNTDTLEKVCRTGGIPLISPLAYGEDEVLYNINADTVASKIAGSLPAEKLVFLTDQPGIMRNSENKDSLISILRPSQADLLIRDEVITSGMIPKVQAGLEAMKAGVKKVHLIGGNILHALLLEIFTSSGVGTEIVPE